MESDILEFRLDTKLSVVMDAVEKGSLRQLLE